MTDRHSAIALALLGVGLASGCVKEPAFSEVADARFGRGEREAALAVAARAAAAAASTSLDRYLLISGRKMVSGQAFVQTTPDTWGPFEFQVHTGFFDPAQMAAPDGVRSCIEIDDVGFSTYYDLCAQYNLAGGLWQVFAFKQSGSIMGTVNIASNEIELRVEQEGDEIEFKARAFGAGSWSDVSSTGFPAPGEPLKASFGATGLSKGTAVGFDDIVYESSAPPVPPTGAVAVAADVNAALLEAYDAFEDLDGAGPDFGAAADNLDDAASALGAAQTGAAGLPVSKPNQSAAKLIAKAEKGVEKAQGAVADENVDKARKGLEKVGASLIEAALLLNPQPF